MLRKMLLGLYILLLPLIVVRAQEDSPQAPAGLFVFCLYYGQVASHCTVRCYNAYSGRFVTAGFTNDLNYPPDFHRARFADSTLVSPPWAIPSGEYCVYRYYAKRWMGSYWKYSEWSRLMKYPYPWYDDYEDLSLTRFEPPPKEELPIGVPIR